MSSVVGRWTARAEQPVISKAEREAREREEQKMKDEYYAKKLAENKKWEAYLLKKYGKRVKGSNKILPPEDGDFNSDWYLKRTDGEAGLARLPVGPGRAN